FTESHLLILIIQLFTRSTSFTYTTLFRSADKPIEILYLSTGKENALMIQPRNLVVANENSHVQIIERHQSLNENPVLTNTVTEIDRKSTRLNSSHVKISYADFCLKKNTKK